MDALAARTDGIAGIGGLTPQDIEARQDEDPHGHPGPETHDDFIAEQPDGTFTVSFFPWFREPIVGVPTRKLAREICHANGKAMEAYHAAG